MDTNYLMSSLREMVQADIHVQMIQAGAIQASPEVTKQWLEKYSKHETVVREELQKLGRIASSYKEPPRFR